MDNLSEQNGIYFLLAFYSTIRIENNFNLLNAN